GRVRRGAAGGPGRAVGRAGAGLRARLPLSGVRLLRCRGDDLVEDLAGGGEAGDDAIDAGALGDEVLDQLRGGDAGRAAAGAAHAGRQPADLLAVQAGGEEFLDADARVHRPLGVLRVPAGGAVGGEQALLFVVAQGPLAHAGPVGQLTDAHAHSSPFRL